MDFRGCHVALVTPFRDGALDYAALETIVAEQIQGGVSGLVPCGTTGESPTLSHEEHDAVIREVIRMADGRVPVIAGTGSNSTLEAIKLTRNAEENGASAALVVAPYYNKPPAEGLYRHYKVIADATGLPIIVYNIPGRCGVEIPVDTLARLAEHPRIQAVKEATGKLDNVSELRAKTDLAVLSGDDSLTLPIASMGGVGAVSVLSNLVPKRMSELCAFCLDGDFLAAREVHDELFPLMKAMLSLATNPIPIKTALALRGTILEEFRAPLVGLAAEERAQLAALLG